MVSNQKTLLVTGAAGFLGAALIQRLLLSGMNVIGIDDLNSYYDVNLKKARLNNIDKLSKSLNSSWKFYHSTIEDFENLIRIAEDNEREQLETKRIASKEQIEGAKLGVEIAKDVFSDE